MSAASNVPADWPGKRLGLPEAGPRSIGRFGRRLGALAVDWGIAYLLSWVFFRPDPDGFATLGIFGVLQVVFLLIVNGSEDTRAIAKETAFIADLPRTPQIRHFENTGHGVSIREPRQFAALVNEFAAQVTAP